MKFPGPWRSIYCGDCYRIIDTNGVNLFCIVADEFAFGDEEKYPDTGTVFLYGTKDEHAALCREIEMLFPEVEEQS